MDRFVYVGDDAGVQRFVGERTRVSDLGGKLAIPGLVDAHTHPGNMGHYGEKRAAITATAMKKCSHRSPSTRTPTRSSTGS